MADQPERIPEGATFRDAEGNLVVFREGEFHTTSEQAIQTGPVEAALVGAGSALSNIGRGVQGLVEPIAGNLLGIDAAALEDAGLQDQAQMDLLRAEQPVATIAGEAAPFVAAGAATGGAGLLPVVAAEAALGGLEAAGGGRDPLTGALFGAGGGAAGVGLGKVAQRMIAARQARQGGAQGLAETVDEIDELAQPRAARTQRQRQDQAFDDTGPRPEPGQRAGRSVGAEETALHAQRVGTADQLGFRLTTGERINSDTMRQIESGFRKQPGGPPAGKRIAKENQEKLNELWGDAMGAGKVRKITPEVMGTARRNAAAEFNQAAKVADEAGGVDVSGVAEGVARTRAERGTSIIQDQQVADALAELDQFSGTASARDFMATRSELNTKMRNAASNSQGLLAQAYGDVLNAMDDAFEGSAGPEARALYDAAREHQRFIITLERGKGVNLDKGNVNPTTAGTSLRKTFKQEAGRGDPGDLSDAGVDAIEGTQVANYFSDIVGDSGTATRTFVQELISNPARMLTLGAGQRAAGEVFDRVVSPIVQRGAGGAPRGAGAALTPPPGPGGVFPLDFGGGPPGPLDL